MNGTFRLVLGIVTIAVALGGFWLNLDQSIDAKTAMVADGLRRVEVRLDTYTNLSERLMRIEAWVEDLRVDLVRFDDTLQREMGQRDAVLAAEIEHLDGRLQREMRDQDETRAVRLAALDERLQREMRDLDRLNAVQVNANEKALADLARLTQDLEVRLRALEIKK